MTTLGAWREGIRRVNRAPAILVGVWMSTTIVALPVTLGTAVEQPGGQSSVAVSPPIAATDWMEELTAQATGVGVRFRPTTIEFDAIRRTLIGSLANLHRPIITMSAVATYIGLWIFLAGGALDRYARNRTTRAHGFFSASGVFFFRFLRLGAVMAIVYGFVFQFLQPWLFERVYPHLIHDVTVERTAFLMRMFVNGVFGLAVAACEVIFDYARVRAVVEDRRSMVGAAVAALRFIWRNLASAVSLYLLDVVLFGVAVGAYAMVAPAAGGIGGSAWMSVALGQGYILARLWVKLVFWASETALFQGRLAHAGYVARPTAVWPESPAAEAIRN